MDFAVICDPMIELEGPIRPALYLAEELVKIGHNVSMISPIMSKKVKEFLCENGITPVDLKAGIFIKGFGSSVAWLELWMREAFLKLNSRLLNNPYLIGINFSNTVFAPALIWYLQGPPSFALEDIEKEFCIASRLCYYFLKPAINFFDKRLIRRMRSVSSIAIANSKFCASMYSKCNIRVDGIIYPPIDCEIFHPSTSSPSSDYILTYFGKETKHTVIKRIADLGVKIRVFGSKVPFIRKNILDHPNIEFLGRVSTSELVNLYSNADFTFFPFTHEPFGYIPLESTACGTPVLTYNSQGPGEFVIEGYNGWLANNDDSLIKICLNIWKNGYPSIIRKQCLEKASKLDKKIYLKKWLKILSKF